MSWSGLHCLSGDLEKDYIWDFQMGSFPLKFSLDLASGYEDAIGISNNPEAGTEYDFFSTDAYNKAQVQRPVGPMIYAVGNYWETLFVVDGTPQINVSNLQTVGDFFTRVNRLTPGNPNGSSIVGPYTIIIPTIGSQVIDAYLFVHKSPNVFGNTTSPGNITVSGEPSGVKAKAKKIFNFNVYQQAVAITRNSSSVGNTIPDGSTLTNVSSGTTTIVDKSTDRGGTVSTVWQIQVQDPTSGVYTTATSGVHYDLGVGQTLLSDTINITWAASQGNFRVINTCTGTSSSSSGANVGVSTLNVQVQSGVVVDTITFPNVIPVITPVSSSSEIVVSLNPLVGITQFQVSVDVSLDSSNASWIQQIGTLPSTTFAPTKQNWLDEIANVAIVTCVVRQSGVLIQSKPGWGPHIFTLSEGTYNVGWEITKKSGGSVIYINTFNNQTYTG